MHERIDDLMNCTTLKQQYALELWSRTFAHGIRHPVAYEAAVVVMQRLYPHCTSPASITRLAGRWINDAVVQDTYLRIENAAAQDEFLPNRNQVVLLLADMLDGIDAVTRLAPSNAAKREARRMRSLFLDNGALLVQILGASPR